MGKAQRKSSLLTLSTFLSLNTLKYGMKERKPFSIGGRIGIVRVDQETGLAPVTFEPDLGHPEGRPSLSRFFC